MIDQKYVNLVTRLRYEKEKAFEELYYVLYDQILYFVRKIVPDHFSAEEIVSDTFLKLYKRIEDFDHISPIKDFLYTTAKNAGLNYLRDSKRKLFDIEPENLSDELIEEMAMESEVLAQIKEQIEALPGKCKEVLKMIFFEGKKTEEIARELNIEKSTVRNQKTKALNILREKFFDKGALIMFMLYALTKIFAAILYNFFNSLVNE